MGRSLEAPNGTDARRTHLGRHAGLARPDPGCGLNQRRYRGARRPTSTPASSASETSISKRRIKEPYDLPRGAARSERAEPTAWVWEKPTWMAHLLGRT